MAESPIDTRVRQETPEGVELTLAPAGPIPRALAWLIDFGLRGVAYGIGAGVLGALGSGGGGVALIAAFLLEWGYPVVFEYQTGRTPGKQALKLRVVQDDGAPLTLAGAVLRNLVRFVDFLPVGYVFGLTACLSSRHFRRLGDLAAGTLVVHEDRVTPRPLVRDGAPRPPFMPLLLDEQRAIVAFAQRAPGWSEERREELAEHSGACTRGSARERVQQLHAFARWIAGER